MTSTLYKLMRRSTSSSLKSTRFHPGHTQSYSLLHPYTQIMRTFIPQLYHHQRPSLLLIFTLFASSRMVSSAAVFDSGGVLRTAGNEDGKDLMSTAISCTTFNILAPIFKRLDSENSEVRESQFREMWLERNRRILDMLLKERSLIICLQEFWVGRDEFASMYLNELESAGYVNFKLARPNKRGDGLLTSVNQDYFKVINYRELLFNDVGDRVAQLLHVQSRVPLPHNLDGSLQQEIIIVNTHLLFPHDSSLSATRIHEAYKILQYLELYQRENTSNPTTVILCGDWNGSKRGHVYRFMRSQGFESSYDVAHNYSDADAHKWISHRNHRENICGVDFIWLLNPDKIRKPLIESWGDAVLGLVKYQLQKALLDERGAFALFKADSNGDLVTYSGFYRALKWINLTGDPHGLSSDDVRHLWFHADVDGDGVIDYHEFQNKIWNPLFLSKHSIEDTKETKTGITAIGLKVKNAVFYPREVEKGIWPEDYNLSDHACLTVFFTPVKLSVPSSPKLAGNPQLCSCSNDEL